MPSEEHFNEVIYDLSEYAKLFSEPEVANRTANDGSEVVDINIESDQSTEHYILTAPDDDFVRVVYQYNLVKDMAVSFNDDEVDNIIEKVESDEGDELWMDDISEHGINNEDKFTDDELKRYKAAFYRVNSVSNQNMNDLRLKLNEIFSEDTLSYRFTNTECDNLQRFIIFHRLFPFHDEIGVQELYDTHRRVKSSGNYAKNYLRYAFRITSDFELDTEEDLSGINLP